MENSLVVCEFLKVAASLLEDHFMHGITIARSTHHKSQPIVNIGTHTLPFEQVHQNEKLVTVHSASVQNDGYEKYGQSNG